MKGRVALLPQNEQVFRPLHLTKATTLAQLAEEYVLFTHALLFSHGNWQTDPTIDFFLETNPEGHARSLLLPRAGFQGLEVRDRRGRRQPDWNYRLFLMPRLLWPDYYRYMSQLGGINRDEHRCHRLLAQLLPMPDILALDQGSRTPCPLVHFVGFGLTGNDRIVYWVPATRPPLDKPTVHTGPPEPEAAAWGEAILAGKDPEVELAAHTSTLAAWPANPLLQEL